MNPYQALYCFLPDFDAVVYGDAYDDGRSSDRPSYSVWMVGEAVESESEATS